MRVKIWDGAIRLLHWLLVLLVAISWWTAENGELEYHRYSGYAILGLLIFRIYWGFAGSWTARFASFVKGPQAILAYIRQPAERGAVTPGHNPLGALNVVALLLVLVAQVVLGLFAVDVDGIESGPLSHLVSFDTGRTCAEVHEILFNVLLGLIAIHIAAVLYYLVFKRDNLISPMVHGRREFDDGAAPKPASISLLNLAIGIALAGGLAWWVVSG